MKSVSLDDDNLPVANTKPTLERSSSSNSLENKTPEDRSSSAASAKADTIVTVESEKVADNNPSVTKKTDDFAVVQSKITLERSLPSNSHEKKGADDDLAAAKGDRNSTLKPEVSQPRNQLIAKKSIEEKTLRDTPITKLPPKSNIQETVNVNCTKVTEDYIVVSRKKRKKPETKEQAARK